MSKKLLLIFVAAILFAQTKGFHLPWLLPAVIDGLAIALGCVAYAASLDGRPGVVARLGTAVAVAASATSNATFAWKRSGDLTTVVIAAGVPVAANLAFEVLLHELRPVAPAKSRPDLENLYAHPEWLLLIFMRS